MSEGDIAAWKEAKAAGQTTLSSEMKQRLESACHEMDETMIARWNDTVAPDDHVWHLGDFAYKSRRCEPANYLYRLNGKKHLIRGNHDGQATWASTYWAFSECYAELRLDKTSLVLFHYAMRVWNGSFRKQTIQLFGHSHGVLPPLVGQCDVGVDCWDFRPVSLEQIKDRINWEK